MFAAEAGARVLLIVVLGVAVLSKIRSRSAIVAFADSLGNVSLLRRQRVRRIAAYGVPVAEGLAVVTLAIPWPAILGPSIATLLLLVFTLSVSWDYAHGRRVSCQCFGSGTAIGLRHIVRNLILLAVGVTGLTNSVAGRPGDRLAPVVFAIGIALLSAAILVRWDDVAGVLQAG